jgi:5'-phosphate synthase pdxT subunit
MKKRIGVLAVQGAFIEHINALKKLDAECFEIRQQSDLAHNHIDGLILPGGESTVMGKLINELNLFSDLHRLIENGLPVLGTCAGLILLARTVSNDARTYFGTMDIAVRRNAFGRQLGSFSCNSYFDGIGEIPMTFIRAPIIERASEKVEILARLNQKIVAAKQDNMLVTAFHPELTSDLGVHKYFLENF